jgi:hypothetical protein
MGRVGIRRLEFLVEALNTELALGGTTSLSGYKNVVTNITAAKTVTAAESGKVFTVDADAAFTITLPSDAAGLHYTFILTDAGSNDVKIDGGSSNAMKGWAFDPTTGINVVDNNMVKFASGTAIVGDKVHLENDGTSWLVAAWSGATNGIVGADS